MRGLDEAVRAVVDARLNPTSRRPLCIAFSGGGDSLALLLIADGWAREHGRDLVVLHVDHGLQAAGAAWVGTCRAVAGRLGREFGLLTWTGDKPSTGLPAAARAARHALLADAAQARGATVILMGHTADDLLEAAAMRAGGGTTPDPREWAPSPAWPEGRGVFLLRPMLGIRRDALRDWLRARGETWIDDPANADPRFARARARLAGVEGIAPAAESPPLHLANQVREDAGVLTAPRALFADPEGARLLAIACVCAGGGSRLPRRERVERLLATIRSGERATATLAGARIEARDAEVRILREAGEAARGGLRPGAGRVWDGRFERREDGAMASLIGERLRAAAGLIVREPA